MRPSPHALVDYPHQLSLPTRWADNDQYGHVNNSVYYFYFDTVVNKFLIDNGLIDPQKSDIIGLVVNTACDYFAPISFPDIVVAGLRVSKLGRTSATYEIGLFRNNETRASAQGHFTHVYVDRDARKPAAIPDEMRAQLKIIQSVSPS